MPEKSSTRVRRASNSGGGGCSRDSHRRARSGRANGGSSPGGARRHQVGDAMTVQVQPVARQGGPTAPRQRHQRVAVLPGAQHRRAVHAPRGGARRRGAGLEPHLEVLEIEPPLRHQLGGQLKGGVPVAAYFAAPRLEAGRNPYRRGARVLRLVTRSQPHGLPQLSNQTLFGGLVAFRQRPLQVHQAIAVHARQRRPAVYQGREHGKDLALALHVQQDARRLLHHLRKAAGAHPYRQSFFQGGQDVAEQLAELIAAEMAPLCVVSLLASREAGVGGGPQGVAAAHDAVAERLADGRVGFEEKPEAVLLVVHAGLQADGLGAGPDGVAVQPHVRTARQRRQQLAHGRAGQAAAAMRAQSRLDAEIVRRGRHRDGYPALEQEAAGPREAQRQRRFQDLLAAVVHDVALEAQGALRTGEGVAQPGVGLLRRGQGLARLTGLPEGDHRRGDVRAYRLGVVAVARPVLVIGPQRHGGLHGPVLRHDLEDDFLVVGALAEHGVGAGELDTARPDLRCAGLTHGFEQRLHAERAPSRRPLRAAARNRVTASTRSSASR